MSIRDCDVHKGHRQRMRRKFAEHGSRAFDTYELLEMLLYHVIPYKDTNPVSKNLLAELGSLDAVFEADRAELMRVEGIGMGACEFIESISELTAKRHLEAAAKNAFRIYDDFDSVGDLLIQTFDTTKQSVAMLLFDNRMGLIGSKVMYELDFESAAIKVEPFIDYAMLKRASIAITAHTHPNGPAFPTAGDVETNRMIMKELNRVGVSHVEHYVLSDGRYVGMLGRPRLMLSEPPSAELERFLNSRRDG